jgi:hypothetical protein
MNNHIITNLQKFQKPDEIFLKDKECLICLETFDLEMNKIVKLPCKCSNSVYHIDCIVKLLNSGKNKNFCPHCKTIYEISQQVLPYKVINREIEQQMRDLQIKNYTKILIFHIVSNLIMNINNVIISKICSEYNSSQELSVLMLFYFCKLFFNYCIFIYSKNNIEKIESVLVYSYVFQTVLFIFLIYTLTKIKNDKNSIILLLNNILLSCIDLAFRIIVEYKMKNTVNVVE